MSIQNPPASAQTRSYDRSPSAADLSQTADAKHDPDFEALIAQMLVHVGENPTRNGLRRTPRRAVDAIDYLTNGYDASLEEIVSNALFDTPSDNMVFIKDIEYYSLCERHMLPFFGTAHIAYLPHTKSIALSKIAHIVDVFAHRLQSQQRLTDQIADALVEMLEPRGVAVMLEGHHFCLMMLGIQKQNDFITTSALRGAFNEDAYFRTEFLQLVR